MAIYSYKAVTATGEVVNGTKEANTKNELFTSLKREKLTPINATEKKSGKTSAGKKDLKSVGQVDIIPEKITSKDYAILCRQAYTMLNAGMNIISTLQILSTQIENNRLREHIGKVSIELQKGYPLSTCLKLYPKVFPPLFINMVESGELTGNLDNVLNSLSEYYEREDEINRRIRKATLYPKVISVIIVSVVFLLMIFVVPTFMKLFDDSGTPLPEVTQALIAVSDFCTQNWYLIIAVIVAIIFFFSEVKKHEKSKLIYDKVIFKTPIVGPAIVKIATARFARTAGTLLESGIPVIPAIKSAAQVCGNSIVKEGVDEVSDEIRSGQSLSVMLNKIGFFPQMMISMVNIGEESGDIVGLLDKTADYYEAEMEEAIDTLTGLLEPLMIVTLSIVVGFVVIAILLPVLDMANTIS